MSPYLVLLPILEFFLVLLPILEFVGVSTPTLSNNFFWGGGQIWNPCKATDTQPIQTMQRTFTCELTSTALKLLRKTAPTQIILPPQTM